MENFKGARTSIKPSQVTIQAFTKNQGLNQDLVFQQQQIKRKNEDLNYFRHAGTANRKNSTSSFADEDVDPISVKMNSIFRKVNQVSPHMTTDAKDLGLNEFGLKTTPFFKLKMDESFQEALKSNKASKEQNMIYKDSLQSRRSSEESDLFNKLSEKLQIPHPTLKSKMTAKALRMSSFDKDFKKVINGIIKVNDKRINSHLKSLKVTKGMFSNTSHNKGRIRLLHKDK